METINEMCELTPPCECDCNPDKDLSQGNIRPNYSPSPCGADGGVCGEHILEHPLHLWAIKYGVEGHLKFIGVAVVQAPTRSAAECIFAKNSLFSGTPERLKILAMKEVMPWSEPILFEDCAAIIDKRNLKSYPFLLKSDYEHNIQNISDNVIEAVEDYIEHNPIQQVQSNWEETDETSKAYILNKPEIPAEQVNADWESESGKSQILNKPTDLVHTSDIEGLLRNDGSVYTGKYLEQIRDLDNFQASEGKIVQYIGETNAKYTNSFNYKKVGTKTIIPVGTDYYTVNESTGELAKVGIPNGNYYKIEDLNDPIANNFRWHTQSIGTQSEELGSVPIRNVLADGYINEIVDIGFYGLYNKRFLKIKEVGNLNERGGLKTGYTQITKNSYVVFEDDTTVYFRNSGEGDDNLIPLNYLNIYENEDGLRVYQYRNYNQTLFPVELNNGVYQVIGRWAGNFIGHTTSEQVIIDTEEWQQCIPPEEDTSHYVTDSEIGWIEH